ncbi:MULTISPECIES: hypothetical protein [Cysteiniphilum]|uniref:Uncharacterized protein n=1 Tax=Cysteiniphilum litorale TaxID=2056700 RepID=A0A8J3E953_9GAMM|nr:MULTISPECIES: hypothetical protein [Cysteiniphilum]GGF96674.1 hypothetical protein GCM10010995_12410 [Cysteiniphilum litorale]
MLVRKVIPFSLLLFSATIHSQPIRPEYVYRVDVRSPDEIIESGGFHASGSNRNIIQHLGREDGQNSAFIATTGTWDRVENIARALVRFNHEYQGRPLYVYTVRPDNHFWSAYETLQYIAETAETNVAFQAINLVTVAMAQDEWFATDIPIRQVAYANQINVNLTGRVDVLGERINIDQYRPINAQANVAPYTNGTNSALNTFRFLRDNARRGLMVPLLYCVGKGSTKSITENCNKLDIVDLNPDELIGKSSLYIDSYNENASVRVILGSEL